MTILLLLCCVFLALCAGNLPTVVAGATAGKRQPALATRLWTAGLLLAAAVANVQTHFVPAVTVAHELAES